MTYNLSLQRFPLPPNEQAAAESNSLLRHRGGGIKIRPIRCVHTPIVAVKVNPFHPGFFSRLPTLRQPESSGEDEGSDSKMTKVGIASS